MDKFLPSSSDVEDSGKALSSPLQIGGGGGGNSAKVEKQNLWKGGKHGTRPDMRPPVADGWAGADMRVFSLFNSSVTDRPTDRRTDRRTDKASYRVACPQLKKKKKKKKKKERK